MNPDTSGQSSSDMQRQTAASIARKKVLEAYASAAKKQAGLNEDGQPNKMKNEASATRINSESWKRYHTAWQDYYQKYYSQYYSNAAREYIAKEHMKSIRAQAEEEEILSGALSRARGKNTKNGNMILQNSEMATIAANDPRDDNLRQRIRRKATDNARKSRKYRKLIPIFAGVAVALTILFLQYNRLIFAPIMAYVSPGNAPAQEIEALDPTVTRTISADPKLLIPKLNIDVPINFGVALEDVMEAMNHGVAHYRINGASAYPGEIGNFIITGHSAGDVYSSNPYKYIFSGLERLEEGDLIYVNYNSVRYTYRVTKKEVVEPTNVRALVVQTDKPIITLVTCTPLGTSRYRLLVTGEQISPSTDGNKKQQTTVPDVQVDTNETTELPSNEPSFFERIWNFLTGQ